MLVRVLRSGDRHFAGLVIGWAHDPRLHQVLGDLYGEEACLFKDKLIFKPPEPRRATICTRISSSWHDFPRTFLTRVHRFRCDGTRQRLHDDLPRLSSGRLSVAGGRRLSRCRRRPSMKRRRCGCFWSPATWRSSAASRRTARRIARSVQRRQLYLRATTLSPTWRPAAGCALSGIPRMVAEEICRVWQALCLLQVSQICRLRFTRVSLEAAKGWSKSGCKKRGVFICPST